jgi:glycosyltransferase involved in cell wall biosynthesis
LIVDEGDSLETYIDFISKARLMVIPRYKRDIAATGISTYLVSMALQRCVIISEGPGAEDILTDQAVVVPAEDASRLSEQIQLLWSDDQRRAEIASCGRNYAQSLGGEDRLLSDILTVSLRTLDAEVSKTKQAFS